MVDVMFPLSDFHAHVFNATPSTVAVATPFKDHCGRNPEATSGHFAGSSYPNRYDLPPPGVGAPPNVSVPSPLGKDKYKFKFWNAKYGDSNYHKLSSFHSGLLKSCSASQSKLNVSQTGRTLTHFNCSVLSSDADLSSSDIDCILANASLQLTTEFQDDQSITNLDQISVSNNSFDQNSESESLLWPGVDEEKLDQSQLNPIMGFQPSECTELIKDLLNALETTNSSRDITPDIEDSMWSSNGLQDEVTRNEYHHDINFATGASPSILPLSNFGYNSYFKAAPTKCGSQPLHPFTQPPHHTYSSVAMSTPQNLDDLETASHTSGKSTRSKDLSSDSGSIKQEPDQCERPRQSRDKRKAQEIGIPFSIHDIINLPMDEFNDMLSRHELCEEQLNVCRDIRRRGKNKVAAQNCRKRKIDQIAHLEQQVREAKARKKELIEERGKLLRMRSEWSSTLSEIEEDVLLATNKSPKEFCLDLSRSEVRVMRRSSAMAYSTTNTEIFSGNVRQLK